MMDTSTVDTTPAAEVLAEKHRYAIEDLRNLLAILNTDKLMTPVAELGLPTEILQKLNAVPVWQRGGEYLQANVQYLAQLLCLTMDSCNQAEIPHKDIEKLLKADPALGFETLDIRLGNNGALYSSYADRMSPKDMLFPAVKEGEDVATYLTRKIELFREKTQSALEDYEARSKKIIENTIHVSVDLPEKLWSLAKDEKIRGAVASIVRQQFNAAVTAYISSIESELTSGGIPAASSSEGIPAPISSEASPAEPNAATEVPPVANARRITVAMKENNLLNRENPDPFVLAFLRATAANLSGTACTQIVCAKVLESWKGQKGRGFFFE